MRAKKIFPRPTETICSAVPKIRVQASDRIDFDVQIERLKPGDFHLTLTRLGDQHATPAVYYFRVQ